MRSVHKLLATASCMLFVGPAFVPAESGTAETCFSAGGQECLPDRKERRDDH